MRRCQIPSAGYATSLLGANTMVDLWQVPHMNDRDGIASTGKLTPPPRDSKELVEYIVRNAIGFTDLQDYEKDLEGDYLDGAYTVCASFGRYLVSLVDRVIRNPAHASELKSHIRRGIELIETLSTSEDDVILACLIDGTFDSIDRAESDTTFNTIVKNLGPTSLDLWYDWVPRVSRREPDPSKAVEL